MDDRELVEWLKDAGLFRIAEDYSVLMQAILSKNLSVAPNRSILIGGDLGSQGRRAPAILMGSYLLAAKRLGLGISLAVQKPKMRNYPADPVMVEALSGLLPKSFIVLALSGKLGSLSRMGKSFRKYVRHNGHRFLSTTGLCELPDSEFRFLMKAIDTDYPEMRERGDRIKRALDSASTLRVVTDAGTNLRIGVKGMVSISNDGIYGEMGGNIPAGEVYIPPRKNEVEGVLVIDASGKLMNSTQVIRQPIRVEISEGRAKKVSGGDEARMLLETFREAESKAKYPWGIRRVGEFGIGINPRAKIVGPTIINEKTLGTAHVAFGSNSWFGGTVFAITHLDHVFKNPRIWADGRRLEV